jgi:ABC-type branched-subunit amino acid transport system ATPase component
MLTHIETGLREIFHTTTEPAEPLLRLSGVGVRFGGLQALSSVSFDVAPKAMVAIIGPNGAGKSTMLNAIGGLVKSTGRINFGGRDLQRLPAAQIARTGIGRSFQDPQLIDHYSVLENVLCGGHNTLGYGLFDQVCRPRRVRRLEAEMERRARILLEFMELDSLAQHEAGSLSYGARKLIDIARAMLSGPRLLLLDEPSSGLDHHERSNLESTLIALRDERLLTAIVVEHHMDLVRSVATRVVGMQAGEVLMTGTPTEVLDSEEFREAIVGGSHPSVPPAEPERG